MKVLQIGSIKYDSFVLLNDVEDVRRFVDTYFSGIQDEIIIGDLSILSSEACSVLLKFVEEGVEDIICYASRDNVNPVLMSRFDKIDIFDNIEVKVDAFEYYLKHVDNSDKADSETRDFLSHAGDCLDTYLFYKRLSPQIISRIKGIL